MMAALVSAAALLAPPQGSINVAFVLSEGATMIDFAGPWEVFQDVHVEGRGASMDEKMPFRLYTVSDSRAPLRISGGMQVTPDYTFADAPEPSIVVVGAQSGKSKQMMDWLRRASTRSQVVMSVCTGAYKLAMAGLLDGKKAATHHEFWDDFQKRFPKVTLERGVRYVRSDPVIFTAGGLTSGIDLALHVVELYFGHDVAVTTAAMMEYEGKGWLRPEG
jgi:transcriptional regulator GlxA family with amidase domain